MSPMSVKIELGAVPSTLATHKAGVYKTLVYDALTDATEYLAGRLALNTPVGATGKARQAVVTNVEPGFFGEMAGHVDYAEPASSYIVFADQGTRPHWPPYEPIAYWVMRVLGTDDPKVIGRVRRGIAARGTKAQHFVADTADAEADMTARAFLIGLDRGIARLGPSSR